MIKVVVSNVFVVIHKWLPFQKENIDNPISQIPQPRATAYSEPNMQQPTLKHTKSKNLFGIMASSKKDQWVIQALQSSAVHVRIFPKVSSFECFLYVIFSFFLGIEAKVVAVLIYPFIGGVAIHNPDVVWLLSVPTVGVVEAFHVQLMHSLLTCRVVYPRQPCQLSGVVFF